MKTPVTRYKYNVIGKNGREQEWSGTFNNRKDAERWYRLHGSFHEQRGHELKLVKFHSVKSAEKVLEEINEG